MPNIFHQSVEDILKAATPEQRLLWNYIFLRWGERVSISQYCFSGNSVASELTVYNANKIYVAYQLNMAGAGSQIAVSSIQLFNELNAHKGNFIKSMPYWDATAASVRYVINSLYLQNMWFSRISCNIVMEINFIGYRVGI